jgi:hypothetical protein
MQPDMDIADTAGDQRALRGSYHPDRDIGLAPQQILVAIVRAERDNQPGKPPAQIGQDRR